MRRILLYGGTFDPPHEGHRHLLEAALRAAQFNGVWVIPTCLPPHKERRTALSFDLRKAAVEDCFAGIPHLKVLDIEQKRGGQSYTVETVRALRAEFPEDQFYLLMGADMFLCFEKWYCADELLATVIPVVGARAAGEEPALIEQKKKLEREHNCKGIILCDEEPLPFASTDLRAAGGVADRVLCYLDEALDLKRARHTLRVANYARRLAQRNRIDEDKAYLAGLLHDCTKCFSLGRHLSFAKETGLVLTDADLAVPQSIHQFTGAVFAERVFAVHDRDILNAVRYHTTGRPGMQPLELLIYFADACEPGRAYPGVEELRALGEEDLRAGTLAVLKSGISALKNKGGALHPLTLEAYHDLEKEIRQHG